MARTMEQQASIHRQQMKEREVCLPSAPVLCTPDLAVAQSVGCVQQHRHTPIPLQELVAQKEAELKQLRQQLPLAIKGPAAAPSKGNIAAVRPAMRHEQYLMAGRWGRNLRADAVALAFLCAAVKHPPVATHRMLAAGWSSGRRCRFWGRVTRMRLTGCSGTACSAPAIGTRSLAPLGIRCDLSQTIIGPCELHTHQRQSIAAEGVSRS